MSKCVKNGEKPKSHKTKIIIIKIMRKQEKTVLHCLLLQADILLLKAFQKQQLVDL